jgi:hypothetical protein
MTTGRCRSWSIIEVATVVLLRMSPQAPTPRVVVAHRPSMAARWHRAARSAAVVK